MAETARALQDVSRGGELAGAGELLDRLELELEHTRAELAPSSAGRLSALRGKPRSRTGGAPGLRRWSRSRTTSRPAAFRTLTVAIIVANVLVFFLVEKARLSFSVDELRVIELGAIPFEIAHPDPQCGPLGEEIRCGVTDGVSPPQEAISLP